MSKLITELITKDEPFIFTKFGDGEFAAASGHHGANCDNDSYTTKLKTGLHEAANYFSHLSNAYIGAWHTQNVPAFFDSIVSGKIRWVNYHTCIMDDESFIDEQKFNLFKSIKESKRKKLLIANELLIKAKYLLNADNYIIIPYRNWVDTEFDRILNEIIAFFGNDKYPMILMCGGMGTKYLFMHLHKRYPCGIFIDIGSGIDYLCTKRSSRGANYSYATLERYFEEMLPDNWNDPCFNYIYECAKNNIGIHLPKN